MVTWTFDLAALCIGLMLGVVIGACIALYTMLHDGGLWQLGFMDGANFKDEYAALKAHNGKGDAE